MTRLDLFEGLDTLQLSSIARGGRGGGVVMSLVSMRNVAKSILGCFTKCCNALTIIDTGNFFSPLIFCGDQLMLKQSYEIG